jgi:GH25 family lysozyme M1 (1,4-beta-N-acetylmuramidase)/peptidoglycan hydrolase-like protein with peptidoglycan-binding domain
MAYLKGIDVSHHQGTIDWSKVDGDVKFVHIKATEGTSFVDPNFHANFSGAKTSGRKVGAYHFARFSDKKEAQAEALHFLSVVSDYDLDFHILDLEVGSGDLTDAVNAFFQVLRKHKCGGLLLYSNPSFMRNHLKKEVVADDVLLWVAHYGVDKPTVLYWPDWMFWQYTSAGTVSGISGRVDMNYAKPEVIGGKIEQMAEVKPIKKPAPKPKDDGLLRQGDKGPAVKELQEKLLKAGEKLPRYGADGDFGAETEEAVKAFQARHGLAVDGIWGPKSEAMMEKVLNNKAKSKITLPSGVLKKGDRGEKVKQLQKALNQLHFNCGAVDGIYGNKTEDAVRRFQMVYLPYEVDGIYGPHTKKAMEKQL